MRVTQLPYELVRRRKVRCGLQTFFKGSAEVHTSESRWFFLLSMVRHSCTAVMTWPNTMPLDSGLFFQTALLCSPGLHVHFLPSSCHSKDPLPPHPQHLLRCWVWCMNDVCKALELRVTPKLDGEEMALLGSKSRKGYPLFVCATGGRLSLLFPSHLPCDLRKCLLFLGLLSLSAT